MKKMLLYVVIFILTLSSAKEAACLSFITVETNQIPEGGMQTSDGMFSWTGNLLQKSFYVENSIENALSDTAAIITDASSEHTWHVGSSNFVNTDVLSNNKAISQSQITYKQDFRVDTVTNTLMGAGLGLGWDSLFMVNQFKVDPSAHAIIHFDETYSIVNSTTGEEVSLSGYFDLDYTNDTLNADGNMSYGFDTSGCDVWVGFTETLSLSGFGIGDVGYFSYTRNLFTSLEEPTNGATPTPEPATMLLLVTGLAGLAGNRMRKNKKK